MCRYNAAKMSSNLTALSQQVRKTLAGISRARQAWWVCCFDSHDLRIDDAYFLQTFEVQFTNNTLHAMEVRVSIDGKAAAAITARLHAGRKNRPIEGHLVSSTSYRPFQFSHLQVKGMFPRSDSIRLSRHTI